MKLSSDAEGLVLWTSVRDRIRLEVGQGVFNRNGDGRGALGRSLDE